HTRCYRDWSSDVCSSDLANQDLRYEGYLEQSELRSDFAPAVSAGCDLFGATVRIAPIDSVKRHSKEQYGMVTESIYAPARSRIEDRKSTRLNSSHGSISY